MKALKRDEKTPDFVPDYMAPSVADIDFGLLKEQGIRFVAFDADSTLVHSRATALPDHTKELLMSKRHLFEKWCIASNRITNDLVDLADSMDAQVIRASVLMRKPQKRFFRKIVRFFDAPPNEIAMIGDKLVADMWGAKRAGFVTVWVERIGKDLPWDQLLQLRRWEKWLMKKYTDDKS